MAKEKEINLNGVCSFHIIFRLTPLVVSQVNTGGLVLNLKFVHI